MNNILLAPIFAAVEGAANVPEGVIEKLWYGIQVAVIGMSMVFAILAIIMGVLYLFEYFFYTLPKKQKEASAAPKAAPVVTAAPAAPVAASSDDDEVAAVIAAAIAAYYEQNAPTSKYRIKSFRRI